MPVTIFTSPDGSGGPVFNGSGGDYNQLGGFGDWTAVSPFASNGGIFGQNLGVGDFDPTAYAPANPFGQGNFGLNPLGNYQVPFSNDPTVVGALDPNAAGNIGYTTNGAGQNVTIGNGGIATTDQSGNAATMNPGGTVTTSLNPAQVTANQQATSGPNPLGSLGQTPIPIPGISWPVALGADILLNNGNIFGGGGSIANLPAAVGNVVSNPVGSVTSSIDNLGTNIMGPPSPPVQAGTPPILPVSWPSGNGGGGNPVSPASENPPSAPTPNQGSGVTLTPAPSYPNQTTGPNQAASVPPVVSVPSSPSAPAAPQAPASGGDSATATNPILPSPLPRTPDTGVPGTVASGNPVPTTPTPSENPVTPVAPVPTTGTGGGVTVPPIVPVNPTMPTDTTIASPLDRNYYRETGQTTTDLQNLLSQMMGLYGNASGQAGAADFTNFQNILNNYANPNSTLTNLANQQTAASNTALRQNNLNDVGNLSQQALQIRQQANPGLYGSLSTGQDAANQYLQTALAQQNAANYLSPQERNTAQQAARDAWGARGLVNSPGAVGDEILNTDALLRARQQQAFTNTGQALQSFGQNTALQSANSFDPFATILGAQYGQQSSNTGSNNSLYGQTGGISSGALGNQYVQTQYNPNNPYASDVYNSNYNASNARNIAAGNNAAAIQGANTQSNSALVNGFLNFAGNYLSRNPSSTGTGTGGVCWVARSVYGVNNPKWIIFRHWLMTRAPKWFKNLYVKHGEKFAAWISDKPKLKFVIRKWMDARVKSVGFNGSNLHESALSYVLEGEKT